MKNAEEFLREVDEHLHYERMKMLWQNYRFWLAAAVVAVFVAVAVWQWVVHSRQQMVQQQAETYWQGAFQSGDEKIATLEPLLKNANKGFKFLATISTAKELMAEGKGDAAFAQLEGLRTGGGLSDVQAQLLAVYQAQILQQADPERADDLLAGVVETGSPFKATALTMRGEIAEAQGNNERAKQFYEQVKTAGSVPNSLLQRVESRLESLQ